jgi:hypothetical protein
MVTYKIRIERAIPARRMLDPEAHPLYALFLAIGGRGPNRTRTRTVETWPHAQAGHPQGQTELGQSEGRQIRGRKLKSGTVTLQTRKAFWPVLQAATLPTKLLSLAHSPCRLQPLLRPVSLLRPPARQATIPAGEKQDLLERRRLMWK